MIGHFGSIYPGKQPNALLNISARILKAARAQAADRLYRLVHPRRRQGRGRVSRPRRRTRHQPTTSSSAAMSPPTTRCSACSARSTPSAIRSMKASPRGAPAFSPACSPAGPLIVTGPALPDEFDHHPRFKELIDRGAIVLVRARIRRRGLCRPDRLGAEMAVGAGAVRFRRLVAGCRAGGAGAVPSAPGGAKRARSCSRTPPRTGIDDGSARSGRRFASTPRTSEAVTNRLTTRSSRPCTDAVRCRSPPARCRRRPSSDAARSAPFVR